MDIFIFLMETFYNNLSEEDKYKVFTIFWDKCKDKKWFQELIYEPYDIDNIWDDLEDYTLEEISA